MAFLDETGLSELWSLISGVDDVLASDIAKLQTGCAKIETGSYVGSNAVSGSTYYKSITLSFQPKLLFIFSTTPGVYATTDVAFVPCMNLTNEVLGYGYLFGQCPDSEIHFYSGTGKRAKMTGNTVTIYEGSARYAMNDHNNTYTYIAIG